MILCLTRDKIIKAATEKYQKTDILKYDYHFVKLAHQMQATIVPSHKSEIQLFVKWKQLRMSAAILKLF